MLDAIGATPARSIRVLAALVTIAKNGFIAQEPKRRAHVANATPRRGQT
jgi:hypothetical protein